MRIFVTGGSGLIGRRLVRALLDRGDEVVVLTRRADELSGVKPLAGATLLQGDPLVPDEWENDVGRCDAVVNLAGQGVFSGRWTPETRRLIRDSRVYGTGHLVAAIARAEKRPNVLVQGSAIGYYGPHDDETLTEESPPGTGFLAQVCREWEAAAAPVARLGVRLATLRTGLVLDREGGILRRLEPLYRYVPGGAAAIGSGKNRFLPGTGNQWVSWIHVQDLVGLILFSLDQPAVSGPLNGTAPNPVQYKTFGRELAHVLWRPFLPVGPPDVVLRWMLGEMGEVVTQGQRVEPGKAQALGYHFSYPVLPSALREIFK